MPAISGSMCVSGGQNNDLASGSRGIGVAYELQPAVLRVHKHLTATQHALLDHDLALDATMAAAESSMW